jgi:hypothetical protein
MTVFRQHLEDANIDWPAQRGLKLLRSMTQAGSRIALLCACAAYTECHRSLIVATLSRLVEPRRLVHVYLSAR